MGKVGFVFIVVVAVASLGLIFQDSFAQAGYVNLTPKGGITDTNSYALDTAYGIDTFTIGSNTYVAVTSFYDNGIQIINISNPSTITATDSITDNSTLVLDEAIDVATFTIGEKTYVAVTSYSDDGVQIIDVSDPANISATDSITDTGSLVLDGARKISIFTIGEKTYAAVTAFNDDGVQIIDVSDPANISATGNIDNNDSSTMLDGAMGIDTFVIGEKTYAAVAVLSDKSVQILDISDPANISATDFITDNNTLVLDEAFDITTFTIGTKTYVAVTAVYDNGVQIIDVSDPDDISATDSITDTGSLILDSPRGITSFSLGPKTYVAASSSIDDGIQIIDVSDPTNVTPAGKVRDTSSIALDTPRDLIALTIDSDFYMAVVSQGDSGVQMFDMNSNPIANAGPDQTVAPGATVTLDGSKSSDPDGDDITYSWSAPTGTTITDGTTASPTFTAPTSGSVTITLTVSDETTPAPNRDTDTVTITVNAAPDADAGDDRAVARGASVTLDGSGSSDPEGNSLTYSWVRTSGLNVTLTNPTTAMPTFTAPNTNGSIVFTLTVSDGTSPDTDTVTITVSQAPTANAGPDQRVAHGATVTLDGSGSSDPDGDPIAYYWRQISGPNMPNLRPTAMPTFTAPTTSGDLVFRLTVIAGGLSATDDVTITVTAAPTANAGDNQAVALSSSVTLDGSKSSDPENDSLTYSWVKTSGPDVTLSDSAIAKPTFTAPSSSGTIVFTLTVSDGPNSASDSVTITVSAAPTANAGMDQRVARSSSVTLDGSGSSDSSSRSLTYSWEQTSGTNVTLSDSTVAKPTFTAPATSEDLVFTLTVTAGGVSASDTVTITVSQTPTAEAGDAQTVATSSTVTLSGSGSDPDNDPITYSWEQTSGTTVSLTGKSTTTPTFTAPTTSEDLVFTLTVSDGGLEATDTVTITVSRTPVAEAGNNQRVAPSSSVSLDGSASSDPDGDTISYSWSKTSGGTITLTGATTATPSFTAPSTAGDITFTLTVTAGGLSATDDVTITVTAAPTANAGDNQAVALSSSVTLDGSKSSDPENDSLTYSWVKTSGPDVTLSDSAIAKPTFTAPSSSGTIVFTLTVSDGPNSASDSVTITVSAAPTANAGMDQRVARSSSVTLDGSGSSDSSSRSLTYSWEQTSGTNVTLSDSTVAKPTFTAPATSEDLVFTLTVTAGGVSASDTVTITVSQTPTAEAGDAQTVATSSTVTLSGSGSDPDNDPITYSWEQTSGTTVSLTGKSTTTPTFTAPTTSEDLVFTLTVSDGGLEATDTVTITVSRTPVAEAGNNQRVAPSSSVSLDGSASSDPDGDTISYSWSKTSGGTITLTGATTATPSFTAPSTAGDITFTLTVTAGGLSATDDVTITVTAAPTANAGDNQAVALSSSVTLDGSKSSDPENDSLTYSWVKTSGPDVTLSDSAIAKPTFTAPSSSGTIVFTLTVSDGPNSASDTVTITVSDQAPSANAGNDQTVAPGATVTLSGSGTDPNGDSLSYSWAHTSGTSVQLTGPLTQNPTFTAPTTTGDITFTLTVSDGTSSDSDTVTITVATTTVSSAPNADAGNDRKVGFGTTVRLDGSRSSDPDGNSLTYSWAKAPGSSIELKNPTSVNPTFIAPSSSEVITITLIVFDGTNTDSDTVTITVSAPPTADAGPDQTVASGTTVTLDGTASTDSDDTILTYFWSKIKGPDVRLSGDSTAQPTFTAPPSSTPITFRLVVSDGASVDNDEVIITSTLQGQATQSIQELEDVLVSMEFTGPNTITVTYVKAMHTFIDSYLNFTITGDDTARNIVEIQGSPSEKTTAVAYGKKSTVYITTLTFDGDAVPSDATGSMHVSIAGYYLAIVTVGGELSIKSL